MEFDVNNFVNVTGSTICWCVGLYFILKWLIVPFANLAITAIKRHNGMWDTEQMLDDCQEKNRLACAEITKLNAMIKERETIIAQLNAIARPQPQQPAQPPAPPLQGFQALHPPQQRKNR